MAKAELMYSHVLKMIKKTWLFFFITFSIIFLVYYFFRETEKLQGVLHFSIRFLGITVFFQFVYWVVASSIWKQIVLLVSSAKISLRQSFSQLAIVNIGKYLPGKVWGMLARGAQMKKHNINTEEILLATVYEQYLLLHGSLILSVVLTTFIFKEAWVWIAVILAILSIFLGKSIQNFSIQVFIRFYEKTRQSILLEYFIPISIYDYLSILAQFIILWILNGFIFSGIYFTFFDEPVDLVVLIIIMILANTVSITLGFFAIFAPGGIGVREAVNSGILVHFIPLSDVITVNILYRLWLVIMDLLCASISIFLMKFLDHKSESQ